MVKRFSVTQITVMKQWLNLFSGSLWGLTRFYSQLHTGTSMFLLFSAFPSEGKQKKCACLSSNYQSDLRYSRVIMSRQVFVVWQLNFLCSLCRSYCIFWDDGWRFPMGSSGWPDRPSAVSSHLSLYQQYLLLLLLLCPGLQHLSVLPPPLGCWVIKIIIITKILLLFLPMPFSWLKKKSSFHLLRGNNLPKPTRTIFVKWWIQSLSSTQSSFIRCFTNPNITS